MYFVTIMHFKFMTYYFISYFIIHTFKLIMNCFTRKFNFIQFI